MEISWLELQKWDDRKWVGNLINNGFLLGYAPRNSTQLLGYIMWE